METAETAAWVSSVSVEPHERGPTSVSWFPGVGLRVAPPPDPALQPEGASLVVEPPALLQGAEQLKQRVREVRG